jgi:hypothetical protein
MRCASACFPDWLRGGARIKDYWKRQGNLVIPQARLQAFSVLRALADGSYAVSERYTDSREDGQRDPMPGKEHLRGVSAKEQREYEHIKESAEKSGWYGDRTKEVAARTVMKQHKEAGHSKGH